MTEGKDAKPWMREVTPPISYVWKSSIPQTWVKLKGESHFRRIDSRVKGSTLGFLRRAQKHLDSRRSPLARVEHKGKTHADRSAEAKEIGPRLDVAVLKTIQPSASLQVLRTRISAGKPVPEKPAAYRFTTMQLDPALSRDERDYVVHTYSLPRALVPVARDRSLHRDLAKGLVGTWDASQLPSRVATGRKGVAGWKLHQVHSAVNSLSPLRAASTMHDHCKEDRGRCLEEPYLEFLRWRNEGGGTERKM